MLLGFLCPKTKVDYMKKYLVTDVFYNSKLWLKLKIIIYKSIGKECLKCGSKDNIEVDHIKPKSKYPKEIYNILNLQILCKKCNKEKSNKYIKDYRTKEQINNIKNYCKENNIDYKSIRNKNKPDAIFFKRPKRKIKGWIELNYSQKLDKRIKTPPKKRYKNKLVNSYTKYLDKGNYELRKANSKISIKKILELQGKTKIG